MANQTLGEQRVRASFNPSESSIVDQIKAKSAELIDLYQSMRNDITSKNAYTVPVESFGESLRLIALAQTAAEESAMWGVKAATHPDFTEATKV